MLGTKIEQALSAVGVTQERVETWLGSCLGCTERKRRLDALGFWAARVIHGKMESASGLLSRLMGDDDGHVKRGGGGS